ncbi:DnaT-like ssDNA-binding domain-containing protein [Providencia sp. PROV255]|uniref:DnaT-like ssDNA-binding domain-containing protein n=1 Tax=Providencia sp. PROV255 TaxID=2949943 RepID=UPI00234AC549|nr:DnaT-like ssDNA-binding domain-containing protein [Providencia sp. PROV255]
MSTYKWLRLWHDMPNDPKWRTISRASKQPIALVQAVYIHLLVDASQNVTKCHDVSQRGHVTVTIEDLASALDVENEQIEAVLNAMQGRVLDGSKITGWESRQPKKEDLGNAETGAKSAAQRKREQRERERIQREEEQNKNACHEDVTKCHDVSQQDKDKIRDIKPLSNTREDNFQSDPNANNSILNGRVPAGGFGVNDKFVMYHGWEPDQDFTQKAAYWGTILKEPLQPHELAEFITYWGAEGKAKTHEQWELALAKGLKHSRLKNEKVVKNGAGQRAKIDSQFAGKPKAMQEFLQHVLDEYGQDAVDALVEDDRNLRRQMEKQEWHGTVIDVEASAKRIE